MKSLRKALGTFLPLFLIALFLYLLWQGASAEERENENPPLSSTDAAQTSAAVFETSAPTLVLTENEALTSAPLVFSSPVLTPQESTMRPSVPSTPQTSEQAQVVMAPQETLTLPLTPVTEFSGAGILTLPVKNEEESKGSANCFVTEFADTKPLSLAPTVPETKEEEIRALWVATVYNLNFPSSASLSTAAMKEELDTLVEKAVANGLNTIFFQVRPASDALYVSDIFPTSRFLAGEQGAKLPFDALDYLIKSAHQKDIAVHAWINPYRVTTAGETLSSLDAKNPARKHPEWTYTVDGQIYYNPALGAVRALVAEGVAELLQRYEVDGIVFDDYFYPENLGEVDAQDYARYRADGGHLSLADWRRENVNLLIELTYRTVKSHRSDCLFGVAPRGIWRNSADDPTGSATTGGGAYDTVFCDALTWVENGWVDYLSPQIYWSFAHTAAPFRVLADWWSDALADSGVRLCVSLAAYYLPPSEIAAQKAYLQTLSAYGGYALYNAASLMSE